jgi:hypothetical protein
MYVNLMLLKTSFWFAEKIHNRKALEILIFHFLPPEINLENYLQWKSSSGYLILVKHYGYEIFMVKVKFSMCLTKHYAIRTHSLLN